MECVNITNLAYNWHALARRKADVIFIQEHKLKGQSWKNTKDELAEAGRLLECSPCDPDTKKPNAGVGVLVRLYAGIIVTKGACKTEEFKQA